jgi:hypothetical protein
VSIGARVAGLHGLSVAFDDRRAPDGRVRGLRVTVSRAAR